MRRTRQPTAALYVRLPVTAAERLDRAAERLGTPKNELVTELVERYLGSERPSEPVDAVAGAGSVLGRYSFHEFRQPEVMTLEEAADFLRVSVDDLLDEATAGRVPAHQIAGSWRFSRNALVDWLSGAARLQRGADG